MWISVALLSPGATSMPIIRILASLTDRCTCKAGIIGDGKTSTGKPVQNRKVLIKEHMIFRALINDIRSHAYYLRY